ncbi:MAG: KTSC domain-containing protein [Kaiparowitsia implicata GSE-PSE-MK54-09C]|jgi:hypothetical protein|nr:KTSC domain-containing protein [Kaiparowitsia implicata GSE-PSE-MK54-09C]
MPSKLIRKSQYDPATKVLSIWLVTNGKRYDYLDVPPETYAAFSRAFSKGWFFNRHIRGTFTLRQEEHGQTAPPANGVDG